MKIVARVKGEKELLRALDRVKGVAASQVLLEGAQAGADVIEGEAKRLGPGDKIGTDGRMVNPRYAHVDIGPLKAAWYYMYFETGTQPHEARPETTTALWFGVGGEDVYSKYSTHPGLPAQPFLRPAFDGKQREAVGAVGDVLRGRLRAAIR